MCHSSVVVTFLCRMAGEIKNDAIRPISADKYDLLVWTSREKLFRNRTTTRNTILDGIVVPLTIALQVKLRRSVLGTYLNEFNETQAQNEFVNINKLAITEAIMRNFDRSQLHNFDYNNNLIDEIMECLKDAVMGTEQVDCCFLYQHAAHLRLDDYYVNMVDDGVKNFRNLQMLVISGNWIKDIHGSVLPRRLKFLELYLNEITSVVNLTRNPPRHLVHLGLARNRLTNNSGLHLLGESRYFDDLKNLDLSDCDIYSLLGAAAELKLLPNLESLQLEGNPCSTVVSYKDVVLDAIPTLAFLDGVEISASDRRPNGNFLDLANEAGLLVRCAKITGLPKPPKGEKKARQTIHVEFGMPLFQQSADEELSGSEHRLQSKDKPKNKDKTGAKSNRSPKKKKNTSSPYEKNDEFNPGKINNSFQTQRTVWGNNMKFAPISLQSPENNLEAYRDTFRSRVNVRIIYLKFLPPEKKKKKKEKPKKKKQSTKSKKSDKSSKSSKTDETTVRSDRPNNNSPSEPQETILKRVTLANFFCDLRSVNWKSSLQFYWSEDPSFGNKALELETYLEGLRKKAAEEKAAAEELKRRKKEKETSKKKKKKSENKKTEKKDKSSRSSKRTKKMKAKADHYMSCQVDFGLSRLGQSGDDSKINVTVESKKTERKKRNPKNLNKE